MNNPISLSFRRFVIIALSLAIPALALAQTNFVLGDSFSGSNESQLELKLVGEHSGISRFNPGFPELDAASLTAVNQNAVLRYFKTAHAVLDSEVDGEAGHRSNIETADVTINTTANTRSSALEHDYSLGDAYQTTTQTQTESWTRNVLKDQKYTTTLQTDYASGSGDAANGASSSISGTAVETSDAAVDPTASFDSITVTGTASSSSWSTDDNGVVQTTTWVTTQTETCTNGNWTAQYTRTLNGTPYDSFSFTDNLYDESDFASDSTVYPEGACGNLLAGSANYSGASATSVSAPFTGEESAFPDATYTASLSNEYTDQAFRADTFALMAPFPTQRGISQSEGAGGASPNYPVGSGNYDGLSRWTNYDITSNHEVGSYVNSTVVPSFHFASGYAQYDDVKYWWESNDAQPVNVAWSQQFVPTDGTITPTTTFNTFVAGNQQSSAPIICQGSQASVPGIFSAYLMSVSLYQDAALTQPLDDWPQAGGALRSPKHIFASDDNIFIDVAGPAGLGDGVVEVRVTSDSDPTGIVFPLAEIWTGSYSNQGSEKPLRLDKTTSETADAFYIKTVDKEILRFTIIKDGVSINGPSVMVLRGKFANCAVNAFGADANESESDVINNLHLFNAGNVIYPANVNNKNAPWTDAPAGGIPMQAFIKDAGDQSDGQAVWLQVTSHGLPDGSLIDANPNQEYRYLGNTVFLNGTTFYKGYLVLSAGLIIQPNQINSNANWNKDVEWVYLDSCAQLNLDGGGCGAWLSPLLFTGARPIHGILGASGLVDGNLTSELSNFWANLGGSGQTVLSAYVNAMTTGARPQPWAELYNSQNVNDKLKDVTPDASGTAAFTYQDTTTNVTSGKDGDASALPLAEIIDNGDGLVRLPLPDVNDGKIRKAGRLLPSADFTKSTHLPFAKKVSRAADGSHDYSGRDLTATIAYKALLDDEGAAKVSIEYLAKYFPGFAARLKLQKVTDRVSGRLQIDGKKLSWTSGFLVQFSVISGGLPIWGNYVNVTIEGDEVERVNFQVYNEVGQEGATPASNEIVQPLDARSCLTKALPGIKKALRIQAKYEILTAELVNVNRSVAQGKNTDFNDEFLPAWHLLINPSYSDEHGHKDVSQVWLDASDGDVIGVSPN